MDEGPNILLVDSGRGEREWLRAAVGREFPGATLIRIADKDRFRAVLQGTEDFQIVLVSDKCPWGKAGDALSCLRQRWPDLPVFLMTEDTNAKAAARARRSAFTGVVPNSDVRLPLLVQSLRGALEPPRSKSKPRKGRKTASRRRSKQPGSHLQQVHNIYRQAIQNARGVPYELRFDEGIYVFFAEGMEHLLGRKIERLTQEEFHDYLREIVITDPDAPASREAYHQAFLDGEVERWQADYRIRAADGVERWLSDCSTPIRDEVTGAVIGSLGILYDITERRRVEERLRESNRLLSTLSAISRAIGSSRTPEELTESLALELRRVLKLDAFYMEAFRSETGLSLGLGNYDTLDGVFQQVPLIRDNMDRRRGPLGPTVYQGRNVLVINRTSEDLTEQIDGFAVFGDKRRRSAALVFVPLIVGERVIGVMSVQSYTPEAYGKTEIELLTAIGAQVAPAVESVLLSHQLVLNSELLRSIVTGTSTSTGADFFRSLVRHLAFAFGVRYALLGELLGPDHRRVRTRAVWTGENYIDSFEFELEGTFFRSAPERGIYACLHGARDHFPEDPLLDRFHIESCMGILLCDSSGEALGVLEVMHTEAMDEVLDLESVLRVFATRAGAELERLRAEEALQRSEEKYRNLFQNALVGMFRTRLSDGLILEANQQMVELTGFKSQAEYVEKVRAADTYVDPGTRERMLRLVQEKGEVNNFEARVRRDDGKIIWLQYSAKLYADQGYLEGIAFDVTHRKEIEQALRDANETLQAIVQASPLAIIGFGLDQRVLLWNPAAERIFGWRREEVMDAVTPIIPQLEFDDLSAIQQKTVKERGFSGLELRRRRKDRTEVDISLSMASLRDSNGSVTGAVAVVSDITEKKRLETERETFAWLSLQLVEAETLSSMADSLTQALDLLFRFDALYFGQRSPGEDRFLPVRAMDVVDGVRQIVPGIVSRLQNFRYLGRLVEGEPYLLNRESEEEESLNTFGDQDRRSASLMFCPVVFRGEVSGILSVQSYTPDFYSARDLRLFKALTDLIAPALRRAQAEAELRRSEARNRALLDALPDMIFVIGADGVFHDYKATRDQLLAPPENFLGRHIREILPPDVAELTLSHVAKAIRSDDIQYYEYELFFEDRYREYEARMGRCGPDEILIVVRDITERKQLEQQLRQALKMEAIGRLAGGIAHDFNNLLTGIVGNLGVAQMDASPDLQPILDEAMKASQRAAGLVSQLLAFGRKTLVAIRPTDVTPILNEVTGIARNTFDGRIEISLHRAPTLRRVMGDPGQIHQVLLNLLVNSRDALAPCLDAPRPAPPRIVLAADNFDADEEYSRLFSYARPGNFVVLSVTDTGIGMSEETKRQVFEPFFTTKELGKGTGLGLATVYGIVKQHNGWINVYSEPGNGSTFRVYLPASGLDPVPDTDSDAETQEEILPMPGGEETVLVADDEVFIRRLARRILEPLGYTVLEAADGEEALDLHRQNEPAVDLVLLDLSMPRLSGQETLARLREAAPGIKVILSSGYAHLGDLPAHLGAVDSISKPYRPAELARLVRKVLDA